MAAGSRKTWAFFFALPLAYCLTYAVSGALFAALFGSSIGLTILPTGLKNSKSVSTETWLISPIPAQLPRGWELRPQGAFAAAPDAEPITISANFTDKSAATFAKHAYSGKILVSAGGRSANLDLFSSFNTKIEINAVGLYAITTYRGAAALLGLFLTWFAICFMALTSAFGSPAVLAAVDGDTSTSKNLAYEPRLDHLRFLAAALVILYHVHSDAFGLGHSTLNPIYAFMQQGHTGVALFMVLSGYLLAKIAYGKNVSYRDFIIARVLRIYPLYLLCVILIVSANRTQYEFINVVGLIFPFIHSYAVEKLTGFQHLWTVAVEFQFYLILPFLILFASIYGARYLIGLIALSIMMKLYIWLRVGDVTNLSYITIVGRIDQFLVGILLAIAVVRLDFIKRITNLHLIMALIFLITVIGSFGANAGLFGLGTSWMMAFWPTIEAAAWGAIIVGYSLAPLRLPSGLTRVLARLGAVSFSLYCVHYLVMQITAKFRIELPGADLLQHVMWAVMLVIPAAVALSMLTYGLIEKPFLSLRKQYATSHLRQ